MSSATAAALPRRAPSPVAAALERGLVVVTGKGGVGKTSVAAALGLAAARRGCRTVVCELGGQDQVARALGLRGGGGTRPVAVGPRLWQLGVDPEAALEEWLRRQPGGAPAAAVLSHSAGFRAFVAAAPGVKELVTIGKIADLGPPAYDTVVVDAPSTGHAIGMLTAPRSVGAIARAGRVRDDAQELFALLADPERTAYVAVTLPEEMPVTEVLELEVRLREEVGVALALILVNGVHPDRFSDAQAETLAAVRRRHPAPVLDAALRAHARVLLERPLIARLRERAVAPVVELPFVFTGDVSPRLAEELAP
jgi:anion-transporting  ArsA/GET3 family ATPase